MDKIDEKFALNARFEIIEKELKSEFHTKRNVCTFTTTQPS